MKLRSLSTENFSDFTALFAENESGCYCAVWRSHDESWVQRCNDSSKPNLEITRKNVECGAHLGFLVYEGEELVGWTGSGPKTEFPLLETKLGSRLTPSSSEVWSIGCLSIAKKFQGRSKSTQLLESVIEKAKEAGASSIEAYPTDPWDEPRSYRGALSQYEKLGFDRVGDEVDGSTKVTCLRLEL